MKHKYLVLICPYSVLTYLSRKSPNKTSILLILVMINFSISQLKVSNYNAEMRVTSNKDIFCHVSFLKTQINFINDNKSSVDSAKRKKIHLSKSFNVLLQHLIYIWNKMTSLFDKDTKLLESLDFSFNLIILYKNSQDIRPLFVCMGATTFLYLFWTCFGIQQYLTIFRIFNS